MIEERDLRTFSIFKSELKAFSQIKSFIDKQPMNSDGKMIFHRIHSIDDEYLDIELYWETTKDVLTEKLNDFGEIEIETQTVRTVVKISVFVFDNSPFLFIFFKPYSLSRQIFAILEDIFAVDIEPIRLNNDFFYQLLLQNNFGEITQLSYQSDSQSRKYTISGVINDTFDFDQINLSKNRITNITIALNSQAKAKISSNGRIALYNSPYYQDIKEVLKIFIKLITNYKGYGGIY